MMAWLRASLLSGLGVSGRLGPLFKGAAAVASARGSWGLRQLSQESQRGLPSTHGTTPLPEPSHERPQFSGNYGPGTVPEAALEDLFSPK